MLQPGKYNRTVSLQCPTCGSMNFSDVENAAIPDLKKCAGCEREITLADLKDENQANVQAHVDEMKAEIVSDVKKQIADMFKGAGFKLK